RAPGDDGPRLARPRRLNMAQVTKHALITGASRGIGRGIAVALAESGIHIAIHYYQNEAAAKETLARVRKCGCDGLLVQADVLNPEQITAVFRQVKSEVRTHDALVSHS